MNLDRKHRKISCCRLLFMILHVRGRSHVLSINVSELLKLFETITSTALTYLIVIVPTRKHFHHHCNFNHPPFFFVCVCV
ncbi:hypothetical protein M441DRAFT_243574 [Trichoderma asperellum CBS 433.97]|uniref:Uncharacterized protein n=1 Tax=Trichoderma asperellum (strain ATCC 204424 / CBS 433.97 / NBRC 101777) TaxID=1042311 RepID=A0A2T3Z2K3_TRIA4|nr:hypothetical protein M441DRAFT_243574 [Trichoderma asperellum CBS 433.97]PTB39048.1 hypothetical protein M441DRAFT_243574 [Trichoderma asperellum CBS 433.97]